MESLVANEFPYLMVHKRLVSAAGQAPDQYASDWKAIATVLPQLVRDDGFDPQQGSIPDQIRAKLAGVTPMSRALRQAAKAEVTVTNKPDDDARRRTLLLKTLSHLYYYENGGDRRMWLLSLPATYVAHPIQYAKVQDASLDPLLDDNDELFSDDHKRCIDGAVSIALRWIERALIVAGDPARPEHAAVLKRWFIPSTLANPDAAIASFAPTLRRGLLKIASGLKAGELIVLDDPAQRSDTSPQHLNTEAYTFPAGDIHAVWVEPGFWGAGNTLTGATNWARIMVHELSHNYCQTADHSYSWQGLLPRESDVFRRVNNARVAMQPGFLAVRTLTLDQCLTNADSWAFFCADAAGALTDADRIRALGCRLYEQTPNWKPTQKVARQVVAQAR